MYKKHHRAHHRGPWKRRFFTKAEKKEKKITWMERYKEFLEKELAGVNERLEELKKEE